GGGPSRGVPEGVVSASGAMSFAFGEYGASSGAQSARAAHASTIARPTVAGVDSASAASRRLHRRAHTRAAAGDDRESVPAATGVLMAQARMRGSSSM